MSYMVARLSSSSPNSILSFVLALRYPGYAVLDGFGLAPGGFRGLDLSRTPPEERPGALQRALERLLRRFRPACVVLGIPPEWDTARAALRRAAEAILARAGVPFSVQPTSDACELMLGRPRQRRRDELATTLHRHFRLADTLPRRGRGRVDLNACVARHGERERYHRSAWKAVALALGELARACPFAAGALVHEHAEPLPAFHALLTDAARARTPRV